MLMSVISVMQVLKNSWNLFKENFKEVLTSVGIIFILSTMLSVGMSFSNVMTFSGVIMVVVNLALVIAVYILYLGYLRNVLALYEGRPMHWLTMFTEGCSILLHVLWFYFVSMLVLIPVILLYIGVFYFICGIVLVKVSIPLAVVVAVVGVLALFYFFLRLIFAFFDFVKYPQHSVRESLRLSWNMTKGNMANIFLYLLVLLFCPMLLMYGGTNLMSMVMNPYLPANIVLYIAPLKNGVFSVFSLFNTFFFIGIYKALQK